MRHSSSDIIATDEAGVYIDHRQDPPDEESNTGVLGNKIFSPWSLDSVSQHRRSAQALSGLGTGRSSSSSGCSPSAQILLSRSQSRSSTLSSEPIMHCWNLASQVAYDSYWTLQRILSVCVWSTLIHTLGWTCYRLHLLAPRLKNNRRLNNSKRSRDLKAAILTPLLRLYSSWSEA
jgi:hypothetical protein